MAGAFDPVLTGNDGRKPKRYPQVGTDQMIGLLDEYKCLFLFDDLDELLSTQQAGMLQALDHFTVTYPEHQYVVTCRASSYRQQLGSLRRLYLEGLTREDFARSGLEHAQIMDEREYDQLATTSAQMVTNRSMLESNLVLGRSSDLVRVKGRFLQILMRYRLARDEAKYSQHNVDSQIVLPLLEHLAISMRLDHTHVYEEHKLMQSVADYLERWREMAQPAPSSPWSTPWTRRCPSTQTTTW